MSKSKFYIKKYKLLVGALFSFLMLYGVSAISAPSPSAFGALPSIDDAAISPNGKEIALFANRGGVYGVLILALGKSNAPLRALMLAEGSKPTWVKWVNNDRILVGTWQNGNLAHTPITSSYIYTINVRTMEDKLLVKPRKVFRQDNSRVIDFLANDPEHILMGFSKTNQAYVDIQKVNVRTGKAKRIKRGRLDIQSWYTDRRGIPRIGQGLKETNKAVEEWTLLIRDRDKDKWRSADEYEGLEADADIFGFTSNPDELIVGAYAGRETLGLYVYDLAQKEIVRKLFHHNEYDAAGIVISADAGEVVGASYVADSPEIELFGEHDTLLGAMRDKYQGLTVSYVDQSETGERILFKVSGGSEPGSLMMVEAEAEKVSFIASYNPQLPTAEMGSVHPVKYLARDDVSIPAYITLPPAITDESAIKNLPFIVLPHGGPYARTSARFDYFAQFFATRGFGVLQMNFRGSAGYGLAYEESGRANWQVMQQDVTDGTRWLISEGYADPAKICIVGWSFGGYAALMGAIEHEELYKCAVSMAGVTDLEDLIRDLEKYRFGKLGASQFVLEGFESVDQLKENSPAQRARELNVPLLLAHGKLDQRVHFDQFERMKSALRKNPIEVEYVAFKDEDHFLSNQANRQRFFEALDGFLKRNIDLGDN